jgi:hypothetical protein
MRVSDRRHSHWHVRKFWNGYAARRLFPRSTGRAKGRSVPLGRYFLVVGGVLLALLLVVDWYLPSPAPMQSYGEPIGSATLHIRSEHKWPQRLQFDTSAPGSLPTSPPAVAATVTEDPKLSAFAEVRPQEKPAEEKQVVAKSKSRVATKHRNRNALRFAVNPIPMWPPSW